MRERLNALRTARLRVHPAGAASAVWANKLPPGTVAMHVRQADKWKEMHLLPFEFYLSQAELLAKGSRQVHVLNPMFSDGSRVFEFNAEKFARRSLFVSADSAEIIDEALKLTEKSNGAWNVFFVLENRTNAELRTMRRQRGPGLASLEV